MSRLASPTPCHHIKIEGIIMKNHYIKLLEKLAIPDDAKAFLTEQGKIIFSSFYDEINAIISKFYRVKNKQQFIADDLLTLSQKSGIEEYTLYFILLANASFHMFSDYKRANISEEIYWDTVSDFACKLEECKKFKGIWGIFTYTWYPIFFTLDLFKLGRLEYERKKYDLDTPYTNGDVTVKKGDTVYSIHIPSCGSLTKELREISYKKAYEFFKDELGGKPMICICNSWLLYPDNSKIFPKNSNLYSFMGDFDIIKSKDDPSFSDAWRVFYKPYEKGKMTGGTSLQKAIIDHIENGNTMGSGYGVRVIHNS